MHNLDFIEDELNLLSKLGLKRELKTIATANGPWVELSDGKRVLQFASNNYLGLVNHPDFINACKNAISKYGVGSSGSRLLSGTLELHISLEKEIANFMNAEGAVFFNSGYAANTGVLSALILQNDAVYSDELNHASIIDGIKLSNATKFIYKHNDIEHLKMLVGENHQNYNRNFIITDSVFSMDGDIADLKNIAEISEKYNCINIVDEAHAIGIFGKQGRGLVDELSLAEYFHVRIGTCSKAMGVEGGFCVGASSVTEYLKNKSRPFIFSTSSSPAVVGTVIKAIELLKDSDWRRERLWQNAKLLYDGLKRNYKLKLNEFKTPIIIVYFNNVEQAVSISERLFHECHIWAPAIRPPSVKEPRIRLTPITTHSEEDINFVIKAFDYISKDIPAEPLKMNKS